MTYLWQASERMSTRFDGVGAATSSSENNITSSAFEFSCRYGQIAHIILICTMALIHTQLNANYRRYQNELRSLICVSSNFVISRQKWQLKPHTYFHLYPLAVSPLHATLFIEKFLARSIVLSVHLMCRKHSNAFIYVEIVCRQRWQRRLFTRMTNIHTWNSFNFVYYNNNLFRFRWGKSCFCRD